MKKLAAIGTLLLSSAAVFAAPAVTVNRNAYTNQTVNHGFVAPAPAAVAWSDRGRSAEINRLERQLRYERSPRERARLQRELQRLRYENSYRNRW